MYILVSGATATVYPLMDHHPNLGVLITPRDGNVLPPKGVAWAIDNGAFSGLDVVGFERLLHRAEDREDCLFVAAPDVVGDHRKTREQWDEWAEAIQAHALTPAFVAQDGCGVEMIPWDEAGAVFIGGTTRFKLGEIAARIVGEGNRRGLWTHMGRVNSARRIVYAAALGCRSIDGSSFSRFPATHLPWALPVARQRQGFLPWE
jgi:hypothetical protein